MMATRSKVARASAAGKGRPTKGGVPPAEQLRGEILNACVGLADRTDGSIVAADLKYPLLTKLNTTPDVFKNVLFALNIRLCEGLTTTLGVKRVADAMRGSSDQSDQAYIEKLRGSYFFANTCSSFTLDGLVCTCRRLAQGTSDVDVLWALTPPQCTQHGHVEHKQAYAFSCLLRDVVDANLLRHVNAAYAYCEYRAIVDSILVKHMLAPCRPSFSAMESALSVATMIKERFPSYTEEHVVTAAAEGVAQLASYTDFTLGITAALFHNGAPTPRGMEKSQRLVRYLAAALAVYPSVCFESDMRALVKTAFKHEGPEELVLPLPTCPKLPKGYKDGLYALVV